MLVHMHVLDVSTFFVFRWRPWQRVHFQGYLCRIEQQYALSGHWGVLRAHERRKQCNVVSTVSTWSLKKCDTQAINKRYHHYAFCSTNYKLIFSTNTGQQEAYTAKTVSLLHSNFSKKLSSYSNRSPGARPTSRPSPGLLQHPYKVQPSARVRSHLPPSVCVCGVCVRVCEFYGCCEWAERLRRYFWCSLFFLSIYD